MERYFDYPQDLWRYFRQTDKRFSKLADPCLIPAQVDITQISAHGTPGSLKSIKAVIWDIYGTLLGTDLGDLQQSLGNEQRLTLAADETIEEFALADTLRLLYPNKEPNVALKDRYVELIHQSHQQSHEKTVQYPEVVIEELWEQILNQCRQVGYDKYPQEKPLHIAYRLAYFFDRCTQKTYLYPGVYDCLEHLRKKGVIQGILSNAQFYTPLHLRRWLRLASGIDNLELHNYFNDKLIVFSYKLGYSKPNPRGFRQIIETLGHHDIKPSEILYVGNDMLNDVWAAKQLGLKTMLFAGDINQTTLRQDEPCCQGLRPDAVVSNFKQITELLLHTCPR